MDCLENLEAKSSGESDKLQFKVSQKQPTSNIKYPFPHQSWNARYNGDPISETGGLEAQPLTLSELKVEAVCHRSIQPFTRSAAVPAAARWCLARSLPESSRKSATTPFSSSRRTNSTSTKTRNSSLKSTSGKLSKKSEAKTGTNSTKTSSNRLNKTTKNTTLWFWKAR